MTSKQRTWGQFATPTDVADLLLGFCLRRPSDRLLDPSCGDGALLRRAARWQSWLSAAAAAPPRDTLYGVELDPEAAAHAATIAGATVLPANFFALTPGAPDLPAGWPRGGFDALVGNPPYTRAEWIGRLDAAAQLPLFADRPEAGEQPSAPVRAVPPELMAVLTRRAGLHAYFLLHSLPFLRDRGRLGFVMPNGWLDVAYGAALKQFLLDHFRILVVIESAVERWFAAAGVNTCLLILERADDATARAANHVRFARLRRPLRELLGAADDARRVAAVEQLVGRLLPAADRPTGDVAVRLRRQGELVAAGRWGEWLRAPAVALRPSPSLVPLGRWAVVHRGHTTGANDFFYLDPERVAAWGIEARFRQPLLKSLRGIDHLRLSAADCRHELLTIPSDVSLTATTAAYLAWGEARDIHRRATCAARRPWYGLPPQPDGQLLLAKGVWQRHFAPLAEGSLAVDQQIYRLRVAEALLPAAAALLNSIWFALQCELRGRVNLGEGVLWLATYELAEIPLPDLPALHTEQLAALAAAHDRLRVRPVAPTTAAELAQPDRLALDELVFDLVDLSAAERRAAREALLDCLDGRRRRASHLAPEDAA
jgi:hypothetical protein